ERVGLDIIEIDFARRLAPVLLAGSPGAQPGRDQRLPLWRIVAIKRAELEQCDIGKSTIGVAPRGRYKTGQERGPHCIEIGADRVGETQFRLDAAEELGL